MVKRILPHIKQFFKDERGVTSGEVAIIAGVLATGALGLTVYIIGKLKTAQEKIGDGLDGADGVTY